MVGRGREGKGEGRLQEKEGRDTWGRWKRRQDVKRREEPDKSLRNLTPVTEGRDRQAAREGAGRKDADRGATELPPSTLAEVTSVPCSSQTPPPARPWLAWKAAYIICSLLKAASFTSLCSALCRCIEGGRSEGRKQNGSERQLNELAPKLEARSW